MTSQKKSLKLITAPAVGHAIHAPPVLMASDNSVDYTCGRCGTVLLHAEEGQCHGLLFQCTECGSYNCTED
jgi:predicted RNA-binding Zn-ribbon protein involved in translation (DUF1610 family)